MPRKNKKLSGFILNKKTWLGILVVGALGLAYFVFFKASNTNSGAKSTGSTQSPAVTHVNPSTIDKNSKTSPSIDNSQALGNKKSVTPIISSVQQNQGKLTIRAYISDVFEDTGTCTAQLTGPGGAVVTKSSSGLENVSYTSCAPLTIQDSLLGTGAKWSLVVKYLSPDANGSSSSQTIIIE